MDPITIHDKKFKISYPEAEIMKRVKAVADRINKDMKIRTRCFWPCSTARLFSQPTLCGS
mgnify:CR=1 FL=1